VIVWKMRRTKFTTQPPMLSLKWDKTRYRGAVKTDKTVDEPEQ
jgi:hypothetical protein